MVPLDDRHSSHNTFSHFWRSMNSFCLIIILCIVFFNIDFPTYSFWKQPWHMWSKTFNEYTTVIIRKTTSGIWFLSYSGCAFQSKDCFDLLYVAPECSWGFHPSSTCILLSRISSFLYPNKLFYIGSVSSII